MTSPTKKDNDPATRTNFDKRTIRKMYAKPFEHAITELHRQSQASADEAVLRYTAQDVQVGFCVVAHFNLPSAHSSRTISWQHASAVRMYVAKLSRVAYLLTLYCHMVHPTAQVYCRKRPINATELNHRVFDVLKVGSGAVIAQTA